MARRLGDPRPAREQIIDAPHERIGVERFAMTSLTPTRAKACSGTVGKSGEEQDRETRRRTCASEQVEYVDSVRPGIDTSNGSRDSGCVAENLIENERSVRHDRR